VSIMLRTLLLISFTCLFFGEMIMVEWNVWRRMGKRC